MKYDFDTVTDRRGTNSYKWAVGKDVLPMWVADMDFKTAPEIISVLSERVNHGIFGYSDVTDEWYDAYINWWDRRHGIHFDRKDIFFSTGVIPTISSCVRRLTSPAEKVIIMTPVYNIFYNCILNNGRVVSECPLAYHDGRYSIDWSELERAMRDPQTTLMLLCNPHNPIGRIWDRETLARIGEMAYENGVVVVSDEIHCDITDPGKMYVPFASVSEKCAKNSVTCIAPTKTFNIAGIQTSAVVASDPGLRHRVWRQLNTDECGEPNAFAVQAAVAAFSEGEQWLDELREYIFANKQRVSTFLKENIPQIKLVPSEATYLLWLDCSEITDDSKRLASEIRSKTGLYLSHGMQFGNGDRFLRMNIACPRVLLEDGLARLKKAVNIILSK
ncbi:MalY/PatB family protein [Ruminococcus sp. HUN007]|uniref:MalY/PatB family protein n=1 Tax=Ruminococcus sp. HUN007 TaxID=1514668 RepID=UPI0005D21F2C|nr:MalY/PatB family protein [Ruminococcus sp. HUN007]